ncbi:hypothetical protein LOK49_LG08G00672 [Camellia lanceoleosa]|uniref:Uncharacterized protein n=1 Tax=Camellia lanceoleosa TaxID=1840588 RepID=A0ACC0GRU3_9ERIC|nr:hypothetical protein LOK49_LG08G00672 [Camellia lanceoleosa]
MRYEGFKSAGFTVDLRCEGSSSAATTTEMNDAGQIYVRFLLVHDLCSRGNAFGYVYPTVDYQFGDNGGAPRQKSPPRRQSLCHPIAPRLARRGAVDKPFAWESRELTIWHGQDCCSWKKYNSALVANEVHSSLLQLKYLNHLELAGNYFRGSPIPKFFGSMARLRWKQWMHQFLKPD